MSDLLSEIRHAFRQIAQRKISSSVIVALIALGIGANTLLFSFVDGILLKSLPVRDAHNLFQIEKNHEKQIRPDPILIYPEYQALQRSKVFESLYGVCLLGLQPLASGDEQRLITVDSVSTNFFAGLGIRPKLGRVFTSGDATAGSLPAVVSYRFWRSEWGGNRDVLGRTIRIKDHPFTIAGVLPREFHGLDPESQADVTVPLSAGPLILGMPLQNEQINAYVRLTRGMNFATARGETEPILKQAIKEFFSSFRPPAPAAALKRFLEFRISFLPLEHGTSRLGGLFSKAIFLLAGGVVVLLFVVCFNVGGLLLTRAQARRKEIAIRLALGASKWQILRQLSIETILLSGLGALLGVCVAYALAPTLVSLLPVLRDDVSQLVLRPAIDLSPDWRVLTFVVATCLVSGLLFGLAPALATVRVDLNSALKTGGAPVFGLHLPAARVLLGLQVVLPVALVSASGLMIRTYWNLLHTQPGFDVNHVVSFRIDPAAAGLKDRQLAAFYKRLEEKVRSLPLVQSAGLVSRVLMRGKGLGTTSSQPEKRCRPARF